MVGTVKVPGLSPKKQESDWLKQQSPKPRMAKNYYLKEDSDFGGDILKEGWCRHPGPGTSWGQIAAGGGWYWST